jgi:hypothetical protein
MKRMRLRDHIVRRTRRRCGRDARLLPVVVLAFSFAFTLWPCCEALGSLWYSVGAGHLPPHDMTDGPGDMPGPCAWLDASDVALPELVPVAWSGVDPLDATLSRIERTTPIPGPVLTHAGLSRGPPLYLELLRLLL